VTYFKIEKTLGGTLQYYTVYWKLGKQLIIFKLNEAYIYMYKNTLSYNRSLMLFISREKVLHFPLRTQNMNNFSKFSLHLSRFLFLAFLSRVFLILLFFLSRSREEVTPLCPRGCSCTSSLQLVQVGVTRLSQESLNPTRSHEAKLEALRPRRVVRRLARKNRNHQDQA
jgi:hypothetical protein